MVKNHPDAGHVLLRAIYDDATGTAAVVDSKQMERAIYNLLLNACQAARGNSTVPHVTAAISASGESLTVTITDDGPGVSLAIRESLFEPFVSAGKQNGTGLGLTLAQCVAEEHGGSVQLASSRPGETVFILSIARGLYNTESSEVKHSAEVGR
jgi:signal transduction histidine kinase